MGFGVKWLTMRCTRRSNRCAPSARVSAVVMSNMKTLPLACLFPFLVSCTTINNVSEVSDFKNEIGEQALIKDVFVCEISDKAMFARNLPANELYENHGFESCPYGNDVASLKKGVHVNISEMSHRSHFGLVSYTDHWYLTGSAKLDNKQISFYFYLGLTTDGKPPVNYKEKLVWN